MDGPEKYDVAIVGGGIIGTSLLYLLSNFSDVKSIILFEKRDKLANETSNSRTNAQTLHIGDIETNYSIEEVLETKMASELIPKYTNTLPKEERDSIINSVSKMVLGVGESEIEAVEKRYDDKFLSIFPSIRKIDKDTIAGLEPNVVDGRDPKEKIIAAHSDSGSMVCFNRLAESFAQNSLYSGKKAKICLMEQVKDIRESGGSYDITTIKSNYKADFVVLAAGGYSLYFAKSMGYGENLSILSVGGNYYHSRKVLNGKVYRVQKGGVPFAAIHGDPDLNFPNRTRFGPTVTVMPYLENARDITGHDYMKAFEDYIKTLGMGKDTIESLFNIIADKDIVGILLKNAEYSIPDLGKYMFTKDEVNPIVPSLKSKDLTFYSEGGGVRPQIIDKKEKKLVLGVVQLKLDSLIFEMAPSPGASSCLKGALEDAIQISKHLGQEFYADDFSKMFCDDERARKALFDSLRLKA